MRAQLPVEGVEVEHIVVAGSEKDAEAAAALGVRYIKVFPKGLSDARNQGIAAAKGADWILPLDADDMLTPDAVGDLVAHVPRGRWPFWIVSPDAQEFGDRTNVWRLPDLANLREQNALCVSSLYPKALWEQIGGYDTAALRFEDWDFWVRATVCGPLVTQTHHATFLYRVHGDSMTAKGAGRDALWRAMMRWRLRDSVYAGDRRAAGDVEMLRTMPREIREEVALRRAWWPNNSGLLYP